MKKLIALLLIITLFLGLQMPVFATADEPSVAIQSLVDEAQRISRVPGISVSVVVGDDTYFFSSGLANRETETPANEETLWELASVSKAFTALGLLYLEAQGLLSLDDSIADHLPWLTFRYNGQPLDMQGVRLYHFLYHTVGITHQHPNRVWDRPEPDTLQGTVEALIDAELTFFPGERFNYGTKNYNVLGLVIENVAGQSYESFMEERIFRPLGLTQTFANRDHAIATKRLAQGYATNFIFLTTRQDSRESRGSVPTGYIISSTQDMARWMGIQLGLVTDIPEVFIPLIPNSHIGNQSVSAEHFWGMGYIYYAAGWMVHPNESRVEHPGSNPGFATYVLLFPENQVGITVLSNALTMDALSVAEDITTILGGDLGASYSMHISQILDIVFTVVTVLFIALAILFFVLGLRRKRQNEKRLITKKRIVLILVWTVVTLVVGIFMALNFRELSIFAFYNQLAVMTALVLLGASITWFVAAPRRRK